MHYVCLKALASFLYLHTDDEFFTCPSLKEAVEAQNEDEVTTVSGQLFCSNFVPFFRNHFVPVKHQFRLLTEQLVLFEKEILSYRQPPPNNSSIILTNDSCACEFCNSNSKLLIKCQHKNCFRFCHMSCFLHVNHQRGIHVLFNNSSVALLYYCREHEQEATDQIVQQSSSQLSSGTRLTAKLQNLQEACKVAYGTLMTTGEIPGDLMKDRYFLSQFKGYIQWEGVSESSRRTLQWSTKRITRDISEDPVIVMKLSKKKICAVCGGDGGSEIVPHYTSPMLECKVCGVTIHSFCGFEEGDESSWVCLRCQMSREGSSDGTCAICGKSDGYMTSSSLAPNFLVHFPCLIMTLPYSLSLREPLSREEPTLIAENEASSCVCEICGHHGGVLQCLIPECNHRFHYRCIKDSWCLFFHATSESVSFFVCCSEHIALIPSIYSNIQTTSYRSHKILFSQAPSWLHNFNRARCRVSLCEYDLINNTKEYQALRSIFIQCGLQEVLRDTSMRRMKRQVTKQRLSTNSREKKERRTSLIPHSSSTFSSNRNRRFNFHLFFIFSPRLYATNRSGLTALDIWRYVNVLMGKRMSRKEVLKLLRLDRKSVYFCHSLNV